MKFMREKSLHHTNYYIEYYDSYYKEWKNTFQKQTNNGKFSSLDEALSETKALNVKWRIIKEDLISTECVVAKHTSL